MERTDSTHSSTFGFIMSPFDAAQLLADNFVVLVLVVIILIMYFKRDLLFDVIRVEDDSVTCSSKTCVRCNTYKATLETAQRKLSLIANKDLATEVKECIQLTKQRIRYLDQKPNVFFYQCLSSVPFWDKTLFVDTSLLEEAYVAVLGEFANLPDRQLSGWTTNTTPSGSWDVFYLINQGRVAEENVKHCPDTMAVIHSLPLGMRNNVFSNVMFSVVKPQTLITEHYGPTNIRLRCHLGLETSPDCTLTVGDQTVTWEPGACLVFDDSFLHCVEHAGFPVMEDEDEGSTLLVRGPRRTSASARAVLIVDLWQPDLSADERDVIDNVFAPE